MSTTPQRAVIRQLRPVIEKGFFLDPYNRKRQIPKLGYYFDRNLIATNPYVQIPKDIEGGNTYIVDPGFFYALITLKPGKWFDKTDREIKNIPPNKYFDKVTGTLKDGSPPTTIQIAQIKKVEEYAKEQTAADSIATRAVVAGSSAATLAAVATVASQAIRGVAGITVVAAAATPIGLGVMAAVCVVTAVVLNLIAANKSFHSFLKMNIDHFTEIMNFMELANMVVALMIAEEPSLKVYDFNSASVNAHAEIYKVELLKNSPMSVLIELNKLYASNSNNARRTAKAITNRGWNMYGTAKRALFSKSGQDNLSKYFQNLMTACSIMEERYFFFLHLNHEVFDRVRAKIIETPIFKRVYRVDEGKTITIPISEEAEQKAYADLAEKWAQKSNAPSPAEVKVVETANSSASASASASASDSAIPKYGGMRRTRRMKYHYKIHR